MSIGQGRRERRKGRWKEGGREGEKETRGDRRMRGNGTRVEEKRKRKGTKWNGIMVHSSKQQHYTDNSRIVSGCNFPSSSTVV